MDNLNLYLSIFQDNNPTWNYDIENTKEFNFENDSKLQSILVGKGINFELIQGEIVFEKSALPFLFFLDETEFSNEISSKILEKDCVLHKLNSNSTDFIFYLSENQNVLLNGTGEQDNNLIDNTLVYFDFLNLLETHSHSHNNEFEFTDFYSKSTGKIILASNVENKRVNFNYPQRGLPRLDFEKNYKESYHAFKKFFSENKYHQIFLKKAVISNLANYGKNSFFQLFEKLDEIRGEAKLNFDVHLYELSLDKIKSDYKKYRDSFYSGQNDILNKISTQIIALPISIAGSAFALFKLKESTLGLVLIDAGIVMFLTYMSYVTLIHYRDLIDLKDSIKKDFQNLKSEDFFQKNESELNNFEVIKDNLLSRANRLDNSIHIYFTSIWLLSIGLLIFSLNLIFDFNKVNNLFILLFFAIAYAIVDTKLFFNNKVRTQ